MSCRSPFRIRSPAKRASCKERLMARRVTDAVTRLRGSAVPRQSPSPHNRGTAQPRNCATLLFILLIATTLTAQVRESIEVRVLELEATVLDRSGKPVEGLKREDFRVRV